MAGVFISYRQSDSKAWALLLGDDLVEVFGPDAIFLDRDTLHAGPWREQIEQGLARCNVTLLVIGRQWLAAADAQGRRLDQPDDVHRREIAYALGRAGMTVIPVLVDDAPMPAAGELPEDIRGLAEQQARRFSDLAARREVDVRALVGDIERVSGLRRRPAPGDPSTQERFVPFALDEAGARTAFDKWARGLLMAPKNFADAVKLGELKPAWVPQWRVRANVAAVWQARRNESHSNDATWTEQQGETKALIDDLVIDASGLPGSAPAMLGRDLLARVQQAATRPEAAVPVRPVTLDRAAAQAEASKRLRRLLEERIKKQVGGARQEIQQLDLRIDPLTLEDVLAPAFESNYTYNGKQEAVWIHAHDGEVGASSPLAGGKVAIVVGIVVVVIALIVALFAMN